MKQELDKLSTVLPDLYFDKLTSNFQSTKTIATISIISLAEIQVYMLSHKQIIQHNFG